MSSRAPRQQGEWSEGGHSTPGKAALDCSRCHEAYVQEGKPPSRSFSRLRASASFVRRGDSVLQASLP